MKKTLTLLYAPNIGGWMAVLKETLYYAFSVSYNNPSPIPTIRKSHEPPLLYVRHNLYLYICMPVELFATDLKCLA